MRAVDFIRAVRDGDDVSADAIQAFVQGATSGTVPDYQVSAFLMAVYHRGLSPNATAALTLAMRDSGQVLDLSSIAGIKVDKHSTGGVGDKISLCLAPLVAACGVPVPMISGRGLGHTGGTLDKLEAIPGFRVDLPLPRFVALVQELGVCLIGQTATVAPADKKFYALRDATASVESIPLITASILAKKLASGIDALVLDVKVGQGAFMKDESAARRLAESLVRVGASAGLKVCALLTRMSEPLGNTIGNALEVREALDTLRGQGPDDITELTLALGAEMLCMANVSRDIPQARAALLEAMHDGRGLAKMRAVIAAQGGDVRVVDAPERLPQATHTTAVHAPQAGVVNGINAYALGQSAMRLGAGRARAEDTIDPTVGIVLTRRVGARVNVGDTLAVIHHNQPLEHGLDDVLHSFSFATAAPAASPLIMHTLRSS